MHTNSMRKTLVSIKYGLIFKTLRSNLILFYSIFIIIFLPHPQESTTATTANDLDNFELRLLRDFSKGKGHGSISRVAYNFSSDSGSDFNIPDPKLSFENNSDVVYFGEQVRTIVPQLPSPINLSSKVAQSNSFEKSNNNNNYSTSIALKAQNSGQKTKTSSLTDSNNEDYDEPTSEDYQKLAKILQGFMTKRNRTAKSQHSKQNTTPTTINVEKLSNLQSSKIIPATSSSDFTKAKQSNGLMTHSHENQPETWHGTVEKAPTKRLEKIEFISAVEPQAFQEIQLQKASKHFYDDDDDDEENNEDIESSHNETKNNEGQQNLKSDEDCKEDDDEMQTKIRQISQELSSVLQKLKKEKALSDSTQKPTLLIDEQPPIEQQPSSASKAYVTIIREGIARQTTSNEYSFVASITLVRDSGKVILIDTGLATDINGRTDLITKLSKLKIAPPAVNYVVTTHGHADHAGNTNDFPDAVHFQGVMSHHRIKFQFSDLFENDYHRITSNVILIKTPGHTPEDVSVLVYNTDKYGTIAIAGDVFIAQEDLDFAMMWKPLASDERMQEESRRKLLCIADYIVPGHGKVFRVTNERRAQISCSDIRTNYQLEN